MITIVRHSILGSLVAAALAGCSIPDGSPIADRLPMGSLVGRDAKVVVLSTAAGTRYDILALDGTPVASCLTAGEVAARIPGQDPRGAWATEPPACGALMLADTGLPTLGDQHPALTRSLTRRIPVTAIPIPARARGVVVFGGSFDPPHRWHTTVAAAVRRSLFGPGGWIVFIPAARSPLKDSGPIAFGPDRVEMLRRATARMKRVAIWTYELERATAEPSYTIDTLKQARAMLPAGVPMRLLIGTDQAAQFHLWREFREVIRLAEPVVVRRPPLLSNAKFRAALEAAGEWSQSEIDAWLERLIDAPTSDLSSTRIRRLLASPRTRDRALRSGLRGVVPSSVLSYIRRRGLYAPTSRPS